MRTTITLEDDVAAELKRAMRRRGQPLKTLVNEALRAGLITLEEKQNAARAVHRTVGFDLGPSLVGSLDNVADVLARVEGEAHR